MKNEDLFNYQYEAMRLLINGFDRIEWFMLIY